VVIQSPWEQVTYLLVYLLPQFLGVLAILSAFLVGVVRLGRATEPCP